MSLDDVLLLSASVSWSEKLRSRPARKHDEDETPEERAAATREYLAKRKELIDARR
jgi:hypothetical protein